jgi:hypothetical protein
MKYSLLRFLAAIVCTGFSFMAIDISINPIIFNKTPLFLASWCFYFVILCFWVKDNRAPKVLVIVGSILGVISVFASFFGALILAFPSVALMLHVVKCTFWSRPSYKAINKVPL